MPLNDLSLPLTASLLPPPSYQKVSKYVGRIVELASWRTLVKYLLFSSFLHRSHMRSDRRIILINVCISIILGLTLFLGGVLLASFKLIKTDFAKVCCFFCYSFPLCLEYFKSTQFWIKATVTPYECFGSKRL